MTGMSSAPPATATDFFDRFREQLAKAVARSLALDYGRVQFTPDLMPADILGTSVFDLTTRTFALRRGPIFTNVLLADEINRAPAKVQSALLEAMEERGVTLEGQQ